MTSELERRYRRWLLAYPRAYRRDHEAELVTTLLDLAAPGRVRPSRPEILDLVRGGLRQRFRLPLGLPMLATAILASVLFAGLGAAAGSWLGWRTAADLPSDSAFRGFSGEALGGPYQQRIQRLDRWDERNPSVAASDPWLEPWSPDAARSRLVAGGWHLGPTPVIGARTRTDGSGSATVPPAGRSTMLTATRAGLGLRVENDTSGDTSLTRVILFPSEPFAVLPLTVLGLLIGAAGGWLLVAWSACRLRPSRASLRWASLGATAAAGLGLARPTATTYHLLVYLVTGAADPYEALPAFGSYVFGSSATLTLLGLAGASVAVLTAALARPVRQRLLPSAAVSG